MRRQFDFRYPLRRILTNCLTQPGKLLYTSHVILNSNLNALMGLVFFRLRIASLGQRSAATPPSFGFTQPKKPRVHPCVTVFV